MKVANWRWCGSKNTRSQSKEKKKMKMKLKQAKKKHIQESDDAKLKIYDSLEKMLLGEGGRGRKKLKKHSQK